MITEDERFIKIQEILAFSDVHPVDCIKINDLIIELSKENKQLKEKINKAKIYMRDNMSLRDYEDHYMNLMLILKGESNE